MRTRRAWVGWSVACGLVGAGWMPDPPIWAAGIGVDRPGGTPSHLLAGSFPGGRMRQSPGAGFFAPPPIWIGVQDQLVWPYPLLIPRAPGTVVTATRLIVAEGGRVRLFDLNGNALSRAIRTHGPTSVAILATRILVSDDGRVRVYDWNGNQQGTEILGTGPVAVRFASNRFVVADARRLRIFDYNGNSLGTEIRTDP